MSIQLTFLSTHMRPHETEATEAFTAGAVDGPSRQTVGQT